MTGDTRLAVLISGSGTNLQAIINAIASGDLSGSLVGVISDRQDAFGLERARRAKVPTLTVEFGQCADRDDFNEQLGTALHELNPDVVILAGFMRILPAELVTTYRGRMLNVHPSLLPRFPGLHTYARVLEAGDPWHGTTVHFVTAELDAGPTIIQYRVPVQPADTEESLQQRVQAGEYLIYPRAINWLAEGSLELRGDDVYLHGERLNRPVQVHEQAQAQQA